MTKRLLKNILATISSVALLSCLFTLRCSASAEKLIPLAGSGTALDPYLIQTSDDLCALSDLVEQGETFERKYFVQTNDIVMPNGLNFKPIGNVYEGTYFAGRYEGQGHVISNLYMETTEGITNYALFGAFGGILSNLGLVDSYIGGLISGGLVCVGIPNEVTGIYRCFTNAVVDGEYRSGMIADHYNGIIEDCWAISNKKTPLVGYDTVEVVHCYGNGFASGLSSTTITDYHRVEEIDGAMIEDLNRDALRFSMERGILPVEYEANGYLSSYARTYEGKGTTEDPYLLSTKEDVIRLSASVNGGDSFEGCNLAFSSDIEFNGESIIPIGHNQTGRSFAGKIDGKGYVLSGVVVDHVLEGVGRECALFGLLNGELINLCVDNLHVAGYISSGIAVSGGPDSKIYNCSFTNFDVVGEYRTSAIVDNFAGLMASVYYDGTLPYVCVEGRTVVFCIGRGEIIGDTDHPVEVDHNIDYFNGDVDEIMNVYYRYGAMRIGLDPTTAKSWVDGRPCGSVRESLKGKGRKNDPYLIETVDDLLWFCASVNSGNRYKGMVVHQTNDLDMEGVYFVPIGLTGNSTRFCGYYDGLGHVLTNLVISDLDISMFGAFFGSLGGTLTNFGIESGEIYGKCAVGLVGEAFVSIVRNCYSKAYVYGSIRSGGLIDSFDGTVISCFYDNEQALPICSLKVTKVSYCSGTGMIVWNKTGIVDHCYEGVDFPAEQASFWFDHNVALIKMAPSCGYAKQSVVLWREDGLGFSGEYVSFSKKSLDYFGFSNMVAFYKWNVFAIVGVVVSIGCIAGTFWLERKLRRRKHDEKKD